MSVGADYSPYSYRYRHDGGIKNAANNLDPDRRGRPGRRGNLSEGCSDDCDPRRPGEIRHRPGVGWLRPGLPAGAGALEPLARRLDPAALRADALWIWGRLRSLCRRLWL